MDIKFKYGSSSSLSSLSVEDGQIIALSDTGCMYYDMGSVRRPVYTLPVASSTQLGGVTTTSTVTSSSGYTACPIIGGVPYYKTATATAVSHVGMIIHSTTLDTMAKVIAIYGGTTWTKIEGRFLLGQSSSYAINATGGEAAHTLTATEIPQHRHSIPALSGTAASAGAHTHSVWGQGWFTTSNHTGQTDRTCQSHKRLTADSAYEIGGAYSAGAHTHSVSTTASNTGYIGSSGAHNNMPPYKVVYIWERTA